MTEEGATMFNAVSNKIDFPGMEMEILKFWESGDIFKKSLEQRKDAPEYVFYDGPPFATGLPHYGHLLAGTIKDIVPRYHAMRGHYVDRRFGWDCHGLPVEYEVEQDLEISGKTDIEKMGVAVFNERCRSIVLRYTKEWRQVVTRMGRWVDFDRDYKTMDPAYMESIWWVFKSLWEKDLIYEGRKILPYCPRCATPLSNFETNQGYQDVTDPAITIRFKLCDQPDTYILAWTTTPWTLPSNMALAVGADVIYARVKDGSDTYIIARNRLSHYYKDESAYTLIDTVKGSMLAGLSYEPLFDYFSAMRGEGAFRLFTADFVTTEDGTGVVHVAPGFGEDDAALGVREGIPAVCPIDAECRFTDEVPDYKGRRVKEADADIIRRLKEEHKLVHRATINHSYPHCWRCDDALIYRGISTWFVRVEAIKDRLVAANKEIHWVPDHLQFGRFGKWLEGARDWAISRNRYWGAPLPVWRSEDGTEAVCIGSIDELEKRSGIRVTDLHKHHVDNVEIPSATGKGMLKRVPEVLDCWFESGAMPYAQAHYPFENKERFESHFPCDFIAEGLDQTRGWFYTLMVLSVALFDRPAFKNVVVNGLVLAEDGKKMSKRLKNYPDPMLMINTYGADALRLYLINSPVVRAEGLRFSEHGLQHAMRHLLIPLWNAYSFFVTYAMIDGWTPQRIRPVVEQTTNRLDLWIRSSLESLISEVTEAMDAYDLQRAVRPFVRFIEDLTNWYIRRSRRRFWKAQNDGDKEDAYETLYTVLLQLSKVAAPFIPFMSEAIYANLRTDDMPESVHLCDFPTPQQINRNADLELEMQTVMMIVQLGRQLRADHNLKVRQPLATLHVVSRNQALLNQIKESTDVIEDELNVKALVFGNNEADLANFSAKADFRRLGAKCGAKMKDVASIISRLDHESIVRLETEGSMPTGLTGGAGEPLLISAEDILIERSPKPGLVVAAEGELVVALDTSLTESLINEGYAREMISKLQNMRKTADFEVTQRIHVECSVPDALREALSAHRDEICKEVLAVDFIDNAELRDVESVDINGHSCLIKITPVEAGR